ncbi:MAG: methionyl-tRNA formyltransferase [Pseudomonadales bacterium]|jgi:methionyl-tRNA formyltransferase|nr:methionyl-tRNA formyltransferase [Pseudomonadales bacterium]MDP6471436.1 methionyl-tRNA formyltransferase [Pseudomonadales bacterium]MDP6828605.1 methionyl-tRNA formyltransferase [Pseudomonadales bacterium]MDP6973212.1 methionyl-tRNA formyltransferase [Pseudomonadales bacterium]|tara:strand:- start:380 stop:1330 length:951 start_codon:yes stop_codon:yes gene_type:complete
MKYRIGFAGTPAFARTILQTSLDAGHRPVLVLTQPDRPTGRGKRPRASPVKALAESAGLNVATPSSLEPEDSRAIIAAAALDVLVVAAYGLILPAEVLALPCHGCVNVHASLLPRWRGAAPVERAIMAGDKRAGVCIMQMNEGLDTGDVLAREAMHIGSRMTGAELENALAEIGARLLLETLPRLHDAEAVPQQGEPSYAHKLTATDAVIDWSRPASDIQRQVRALAHRRTAWSCLGDLRVRVFETEERPRTQAHTADTPPGTILAAGKDGIDVLCGDVPLRLKKLALNRGKGTILNVAAVLNGFADTFAAGRRFR